MPSSDSHDELATENSSDIPYRTMRGFPPRKFFHAVRRTGPTGMEPEHKTRSPRKPAMTDPYLDDGHVFRAACSFSSMVSSRAGVRNRQDTSPTDIRSITNLD